jgi:hypothetical protein
MQREPSPPLFRKILPHLLMGTGLGIFGALALIMSDAARIGAMLASLEAPRLAMFIFVLGASTLFGVGASLTGFIFIATEDDRRR